MSLPLDVVNIGTMPANAQTPARCSELGGLASRSISVCSAVQPRTFNSQMLLLEECQRTLVEVAVLLEHLAVLNPVAWLVLVQRLGSAEKRTG